MAGDVGVGRALEPVLDQVEAVLAPVPERLRRGQHVQDPGQVLRVAGVLQVEAAALEAVERVGHARGAGDHRAVAGVDDPRSADAVDHLGAVQRQRQQVAVAAEARAELAAEAREGAAVAQQQVRGPQRAGAEHEPVAGQRQQRRRTAVRRGLAVLGVQRRVAHLVAAAVARLDRPNVAQRPDLSAVVLGVREVVVIERVLGAEVAADVALAAQLARDAVAVVQVAQLLLDLLAGPRRLALVGEGDGQRRQEPLEPVGLGGVLEGVGLRRARVGLVLERVALEPDHRLDAVVVRVEVLARDRPVLVAAVVDVLLHEPLLVLAQEDVGVDERAAAEAGRDQRVDPLEGPVVVHPGQAALGVPEALARPVRAARERARRIRAAALEDAHALPGLRESVGHDGSSEPGAHHDRVEVRHAAQT